ncbi:MULTISPECIES: sulfur oxidation c-type cytochrome SoxA [Rhodomicrobium]|uniref:sulfur oxidation c-type cytochrome SoxA n=1 Tax=Rhodomicrobium TaxID=1068 RepID=UPI000B4A5F52|nr:MULTISPECIES: sulfur oxidation c-type cytochrome SoxA [Rhodomicrobium]
MNAFRAAIGAGWLAALTALSVVPAGAQEVPRAPVSGSAFLSQELKAMQADAFANPGVLWLEEGERLWSAVDGKAGKSCQSCHGDAKQSMKGVAARYPAFDAASGKLLNLELRINDCRSRRMVAEPYRYETNELLSLTAYIAAQSRGRPMAVDVTGPAAPYFERGKALFSQRQGQLNLSCAQCHVDRAGQRLRGDTISHGVGVGYPVYRIEWQSAGSLHRRLRACAFGVRAEQADSGSPDYLSLELYLAKRAEGLAIDAPAIRK